MVGSFWKVLQSLRKLLEGSSISEEASREGSSISKKLLERCLQYKVGNLLEGDSSFN
jgi:hypothetical protein